MSRYLLCVCMIVMIIIYALLRARNVSFRSSSLLNFPVSNSNAGRDEGGRAWDHNFVPSQQSTAQNLRQDIYEIWYREWALGRFGKVSDLWQVQFAHSRGTISCSLRAPSSWEGSRNLETGYSFLRLRGHMYSWCAQAGVVQAAPGIHASNRFVGNALRIVTGWPFRRGWWFVRICCATFSMYEYLFAATHVTNKTAVHPGQISKKARARYPMKTFLTC